VALPAGRSVHLTGRGDAFVRSCGPEDGPPLLLLHGWTVTADVNFVNLYGPLAAAGYRVIAPDHRGHGRGLPSSGRFSLEECADDIAALADALGLETFVPLGYSMGGVIAQLLWRRHPGRVTGLVLAATARNFRGGPGDRAYFGGIAALGTAWRLAPGPVRTSAIERLRAARTADLPAWAIEQLRASDPAVFFDAGVALGAFTSHEWIGEVDVPTAVVVTARDSKIPASRQRKLAAAIPASVIVEADADHHCVARNPERIVPELVRAAQLVSGARGDMAA
jgi:pimeloyl-ACP methyl ester carboxylesterase